MNLYFRLQNLNSKKWLSSQIFLRKNKKYRKFFISKRANFPTQSLMRTHSRKNPELTNSYSNTSWIRRIMTNQMKKVYMEYDQLKAILLDNDP